MNPTFDLYAPLFSAAEVAQIAGVPRPIIDVWVNRKVIQPTRRQRPAISQRRASKNKGRHSRIGRPMFSCRDAFKAMMVRALAEWLTLGSPESSSIASNAEATKLHRESARVAEVAVGGEWMWACARSSERGKLLNIYAYASRNAGHWEFDMHVGVAGEAPCFGWERPHLFVPISLLFQRTYEKCKQLLANAHGAAR
jgi:hypothetical protein